MEIAVLVLFILTYIGLLAFPKKRAYIACIATIAMLFTGAVTFNDLFTLIDWNVIMLLVGTMGLVSMFIASKMPALLADKLIKRLPDVRWTIIALSLFAGIISAFVDNVATVLMVAPVALTICKKLDISPVKSLVAISVSSNLQGAATLVGDTTSIMLGGFAGLSFSDFFVLDKKLGMFFIVQISAIVATALLFFYFRKDKEKIQFVGDTVVTDYMPTVLLVLMVALLIGTSFIPSRPSWTTGIICVSLMVVGLIYESIKNKGLAPLKETAKEIDYTTLILLSGLFIVIGALTNTGWIDKIGNAIVKAGGGNLFATYSLIVWASVLLSAFIDNIPYVATMLPVVTAVASGLGVDPMVLYLGLLSGATLGGNLTPVGASANIATIGILRKNGYECKAKEFMKISVPFTLVAVTVGYLLVWAVYA